MSTKIFPYLRYKFAIMKYLPLSVCLGAILFLGFGCQTEETSDYTGREVRYSLLSGSFFEQTTAGYLIARERNDYSVEVEVSLTGTADQAIHPVHLHYGTLADNRPVAAWLSPLEDVGAGKSQSITRLDHLYDDSPMTFDLFSAMDGSVKVHFEEAGQWEDVILGATNIGRNYADNDASLYQGITLCNGRTDQ